MGGLVLRPAAKVDSAAIAKLFLIPSDGLASYIWSRLAEPGEDLAVVGARRYAREGVAFSYENCVIAESDREIVGMLHAFPMEQDPQAAPQADPILVPYSELEDYGSYYVSGLAVVPPFRGRGIGNLLMVTAEDRAAGLGLQRVSLICFEQNAVARRLYGRLGYEEIGRRLVVPHPALHYTDGHALLLAMRAGRQAGLPGSQTPERATLR